MKHSKIQNPRVKTPLLFGASVAALIISAGSAMADDITATGGAASTPVALDASGKLEAGTPITGLTFDGGAHTVTIDSTNGVVVGASAITSTGANISGTLTSSDKLTVSGNGADITGTTTITGDTTITGATGITGTFTSTDLIKGDNGLSISAGGADITGATAITGTLTSTDLIKGDNGLSITAGGATIVGATALQGVTSFGTSNATSIGADGTISVNNGATTIDGSSGTITVNATAPAANQTVLKSNGNVTVGGALVVNNSGVTVNMGNNVVSGVANPVAATDAANKAYVDSKLTGNNLAFENWTQANFKKVNSGIAAAAALQNPDRTGNQTWALAVNEGFWNGASATGFSGITHIANLGSYDLSVAGSFAITDRGDVAGRVSAQIAGGGYTPLK